MGAQVRKFIIGIFGIITLAGCDGGFKAMTLEGSGINRPFSTPTPTPPFCTPNAQRSCQTGNGSGSQTCNSMGSAWSACGNLTSCNSGYALLNGACNAVYVETTLAQNETCTTRVNWDAPKVTHSPELNVSVLNTPIRWDHFRSERQQFGYNPSFAPGPVSFAGNGRPMIRDRNLNLQVLMDDGHWKVVSLLDAAKESLRRQGYDWGPSTLSYWSSLPIFGSGPGTEERVVFDQNCNAYTVVNAFRSSLGFAFLLHSFDAGHSWAAYPLKGWDTDGTINMEVPSRAQAGLEHPPALLFHQNYDYPGSPRKLVLMFPEKTSDGTLNLHGPYTVAEHTICCGGTSGHENQAVSGGDLIHIAYPGDSPMTDLVSGRIGTPQYIVSFSRSNGTMTSPVLIGIGFDEPAGSDKNDPVNGYTAITVVDEHNQPVLAIDSEGYLHTIIGGHGAAMYYRKSLFPNSITQGWSTPEYVGVRPNDASDPSDPSDPWADNYSYPSLMLDVYNQPHVLARWSGQGYNFRLIYTVRSNSGAWWPQRVLLDPGRRYYGNWYHKLAMDPWGRIFVSYSYYPSNLFADEAIEFGKIWGFNLVKDDPTCQSFNVTDLPPSNYCSYSGYTDVSPGNLMSLGTPTSNFELTTTDTFFKFF